MKILALVRRIATVVIFLGYVLNVRSVMACSIGPVLPPQTISEYVANSDYVFTGEVFYIDNRNIESTLANRFAVIKVDKLLHSLNGDEPDYVRIYYRFIDRAACGEYSTHFQTGETYTIFAKKRSDGYLHVTRHSGKYGNNGSFIYDENQVVDFFEKGKDSSLIADYCLQQIRQAYAAELFIGEFKVEPKHCEYAIPYYDKKFRTKN